MSSPIDSIRQINFNHLDEAEIKFLGGSVVGLAVVGLAAGIYLGIFLLNLGRGASIMGFGLTVGGGGIGLGAGICILGVRKWMDAKNQEKKSDGLLHNDL